MRKKLVRILSICITIVMLFSIIPLRTMTVSASSVTLQYLQSKFPQGKYWNHVGSSLNNENGYTNTPCPSHSSVNTCNAYTYDGVKIGWQCYGFALKLGYDIYGTNPRNWQRSNSLSNIKPGDIINYDGNNPGHTVFVIAVNGNTVSFAECNYGGRCIIRWDRSLQKSEFNNLYNVYVAPYEWTGGLTQPHTHSYSENYEKDHPHRKYKKCTSGDCDDWYYTDEYETVKECSQCWKGSFTTSKSSVSINVGESTEVKISLEGVFPSSAVIGVTYDTNILNVTSSGQIFTFKGLKPGNCTYNIKVYSDSSKSVAICSKNISVAVNCKHTYSNACDTSCNICGTTRSITHDYASATCTVAKKCKVCGVTSGSALGHTYSNACDTSCNRCGLIRTITHDYAAATCTVAKKCKVCGVTSGSALGHTYSNSCDNSCNRCGATRTTKHDYSDATCTAAKKCKVCGVTSGSALGHTYTNACDNSCNRCYATRPITHDYAAATCTAAKKCKVCGATSGSALGHTYTNACDTSCNRCGAIRTVTHTYTTTTTKATLTENGSMIKKCSVCGNVSSKIVIDYVNGFTLSKTNYVYDGEIKTPSVVVMDVAGKFLNNGTDYVVSYPSDRVNLGSYDVEITMIGNYSGTKILTFNINLSTPEVKAENATNGVKVTWGSIAGAESYKVYRSVHSAGTWSQWKLIKNDHIGTSYTDATVKSGAKVKYTVRACNGDYISAYKAGNEIKFLSIPTVKATNATNGIKVTWGSISGANNYKIYRSVYSAGEWTKWKLIKNGYTGKSYTDTTVKSGTYVKYTVRACSGDYVSAYVSGNEIKYMSTPTVKAANASNGVKVTWKKISGANSYKVYRSTYSGGKWSNWKLIKDGYTSTSYTDKSVKSGAKVKYTVRACNNNYISAYKSGNQTIFLAQPKVKVSKISGGIKASWNKSSGATGYIVYRRTYSNGKWSGWKQIKVTKSLYYNDKTAKRGVYYQYTTRAYKESYKSTYQGSKSIKR